MTKQIKILVLAIFFIIASTITVNAADATGSFAASKMQLNPGEQFTIKFSVECPNKLAGVDAFLSFDENVLSFVEADKVNSAWSVSAEDVSKVPNSQYDRNISAFHDETKEKDDVCIITFKVKDTAAVNTTTKVLLDDIKLYDVNLTKYEIESKEIEISILETPVDPPVDDPVDPPTDDPVDPPVDDPIDSPTDDPGQNPVEKTVIGIEITKPPLKTTYKVGEKFDKTGMEVTATYSDGTKEVITDYKIDREEIEEGQKTVLIYYTTETKEIEAIQDITVVKNITVEDDKNDDNKSDFEEIKEDNTKTENKMPNTGASGVIGLMAVIAVFGVVCLAKYNKYKEI